MRDAADGGTHGPPENVPNEFQQKHERISQQNRILLKNKLTGAEKAADDVFKNFFSFSWLELRQKIKKIINMFRQFRGCLTVCGCQGN